MKNQAAERIVRFDTHMHTPLCGHAVGSPRDYVESAAAKQVGLITFTCHIPMASELFCHEGIRMGMEQLDQYLELIADAREYGKSMEVEVLTGIEAEFHPDIEHMKGMEETLASYPFDFVLGSLHHMLPGYRLWLDENDCLDNQSIVSAYFSHLTEAARSGRYHSLSHPDVIRIYGTLPQPFKPLEHQEVIESFLDVVAESGICLEVNTSGLIKGDYEVHPDPAIMDWAIERNIPFTIGSDSHRPQSVGQYFDEIYKLLRDKGLREINYFKGGQRFSVGLDKLIEMSPLDL